jgi:hypothetical protein
MRTKALLLGAMIGAASLVTSMAQVYSVNIVGYVNTTLPRGFVMIHNPLIASPGDINNQPLSTVIPSLPAQSVTLYKYNHVTGQYDLATWDPDFLEWDNPTMNVSPGEGFFAYNSGNPITVTFVGEVPTGTLQMPLFPGFNMIGSKVPQAGLVQTDLGYVPTGNETIYKYVNATGQYDLGTYDPDFQSWDLEPTIGVGEAFWAYRSAAGSWTRTFNVN